ncbi:MAG: hypothetical protein ACYS1A_08375 [Planctomycetota bacterium]|jgi:hypothetical protein
MKTVTTNFLAEIENPHWYPIKRCYMLNDADVEVEITDKIHNFDRVLWQIEQQFRINEFSASNCHIHLKNLNEEFDIDNASNFFVTGLSRSQDGFRVPVQIRVGFVLDGVEEIIPLFYGLIIDIDTATFDDTAIVELQCISRILRDANAENIGDQWTDQQLYGGDTHCFVVTDNGDSIEVNNTPTGNFSGGFPPYGFIKIEDEVIYYSRIIGSSFDGLLRGQLGTAQDTYVSGKRVDLLLLDGRDTDGRLFQFLIYPIAQNSVTSVTSTDGNINLWKHRHFLNLPETQKKTTGWIDYDKGILELAGTPTDSSSVAGTYKSVYRQIPYHTLVKRLLESQNFTTTLIEDAILTQYLGQPAPTNYGRVTHAYDNGTPTLIPGLYPEALALCIGSDDNLYIGVEEYLIIWDGEQFNLLADLGTDNQILRLGADDDDNIYGISGKKDAGDLRNVFKWNGAAISYLSSGIAAYYELTHNVGGGQWRGFSVDTTNDVIWFLYDDGGGMGVAKINFDGTGLAKYSRVVKTNYMMDFVDINDEIHFFYTKIITGYTHLVYEILTKATGTWTYIGSLYNIVGTGGTIIPCDITYNANDDKIYMNSIYYSGSAWLGYFISVNNGTTTQTQLKTYTLNGAVERLCGGVYHDDYSWYIEGNSGGSGDGVYDNATGHLYRVQNNILEDMGAMTYRPLTELSDVAYLTIPRQSRESGLFRQDIREEVKGHSAVMCYRASDDALFYISQDITGFHNPDFGYLIGRYSPTLASLIRLAVWNERKIWDILSELAVLVNYELGVTGDGIVFWRKRSSTKTILNGAINDSVTTIPTTGVNMDGFESDGLVQIDDEVISYTGKTTTSFTGGERGVRGSIAASHLDASEIWEIHQVLVNLQQEKNLKLAKKFPNYDEIFNYIVVPYGSLEMVFDYERTGEVWADSSESKYGRRIMRIDNSFLMEDNAYEAEAIAWRYYDHYNQRSTLLELETKWQPQLDLGDMLSIKQPVRVLLDYAVARIRRIELQMSDFFVRIIALTREKPYKANIYDY